MKCPRCGEENTDNWPLTIDGEVKDGGCQMCWEAECAKSWWEIMTGGEGGVMKGEKI